MKKSELVFTLLLVPLDFLALLAAGTAAYFLRYHPYFIHLRPAIFDLPFETYGAVLIPIVILWMLVFAFSGLYATRRIPIVWEIIRIALSASASMAVVFAVSFFSRTLFESRFIAIAAWGLSILFVTFTRLTIRALQQSLMRFDIGVRHVAVIGDTSTSETLTRLFNASPRLGFRVVYTTPTFTPSVEQELRRMARKEKLDEIILCDTDASRDTTLALLSLTDTEHLGFRYSADLFATAVGRSLIHTYAGIPVIELRKTPLDGWGAIYKRLFDIVGALLLIVITLPIQIIVALALFLEQPGRILFSRTPDGKKTTRIGQGGKPFHYFKFRSMIKNAHRFRFDDTFIKTYGNERGGTPLFKLEHDPRVTPVGKVLRKFSLDELPEFYLVLLGRMSLVGPRPHLPEEVAQYQAHHRKVMTVKPGITGMGQVSGRANLDFEDEVRLDTFYIGHWSPWLDLAILLKTPLVVLFRKVAY